MTRESIVAVDYCWEERLKEMFYGEKRTCCFYLDAEKYLSFRVFFVFKQKDWND